MELSFTVVALAALAILGVGRILTSWFAAYRFKKAHGCKSPPKYQQSERIIGWDFFKAITRAHKEKRLLEFSRSRYASTGANTYSSVLLGRESVNTIDPENIKAILATNFNDFDLGNRLESFGPLLGRGIFTSDGGHWEHSRAIVRPNFTRAQVADLETFETHIAQLISKIPQDGSTIDLQPLFFQLTLDSATEFLFGESINSLTSPPSSEEAKFGVAFDRAQSGLPFRSRVGKFAMFFKQKEFYESCDTVHRFVDKIVQRALAETSAYDAKTPVTSEPEKQDRYVFLTEMAKTTRNPKELRDELLNILLAGRDTTASLLSHTFHALARRPDIFAKLKAEVDELGGKKPDYETLRGMKYLKYILNESLRLWPVVPGNGRMANKPTTLPRGGGPDGLSPVYIPAGSVVTYSPYVMHRRTDVYGPDASTFRPERWAPSENLRPGWCYLPFNGGPRICVGQQFALTEASYTIVRLVQEFGALQHRDEEPWREGLSLTLAIAGGVKVGLVKR